MSTTHLTPLTHLQLIAVKGEKAREFLQGQLTCDMHDITSTQTHLAAHCSPKGRVLASFQVLEFKQTLFLLAPTLMQDVIIQQLKKYAVFSRVVLEKAPELIILGGSSDIASLFPHLPTHADEAVTKEDFFIIRCHGELPRYVVISMTATLESALITSASHDAINQWQLEDIQAGVATIYPTTSDLFTPHMLNYPALHAVSFTKGCYTGQEVVARTHYLGKAKRHLQLLTLADKQLPQPGAVLLDDKQQSIGTVVNAAHGTDGKCQLLAVIQEGADVSKLSVAPL